MPIDVTSDDLLGLAEAARAIKPVGGRHADPSTLFRWATHGVRGVRLEHVRIGRKIATTAECLNQFFAELSQAKVPPNGTRERRRVVELPPKPRSAAQREKAIQRAEARLAAAGI